MHQSLANEFKLLKKQELLNKVKKVETDIHSSALLSTLLPHYKPAAKMLAWHNASQTHKGIKGGVRSGKTYTLGAEAIKLSYINRPYFHLSISPSFDNACETVIPNLEDLCDSNGLTYEWLSSKNLFLIVWGKKKSDIAKILIHGMDSNFKGVTAASGDLNEPFSISEKSFKVWWERISHPKAKQMSRIWGGTAEPKEMQWGFQYFDKEKFETDTFYADTITTYDNIHLSKEYIRGLEDTYTAKDKEVYMLGKCINLGKEAVFYAFDRQKYMKPALELRNKDMLESEVIFSVDFNCTPMSGIIGEIRPDKKRYIIEEFKISKSSTRDLCELAINRMKSKGLLKTNGLTKYGKSIIITGDASGKSGSSKSNLNDYEIIAQCFDDENIQWTANVPAANPAVRDTVNYVNNLFEKELLYISSECPELVKDLELVGWKQGADGFHIDKSKKDLTHLSDTLRYLCWNTQVLTDCDDNGSSGGVMEMRERRR